MITTKSTATTKSTVIATAKIRATLTRLSLYDRTHGARHTLCLYSVIRIRVGGELYGFSVLKLNVNADKGEIRQMVENERKVQIDKSNDNNETDKRQK